MTTASMNDFLNRLRNDRDLAARLSAAVGGKDGEDALEALLAFASTNGFDVTPHDLEAVRQRFSNASGQEGELADTDLDGVTGGNLPEVFRTLCLAPQTVSARTALNGALTAEGGWRI